MQLINEDVDVKLLKSGGESIRYNEETFEKDYGIKPINIIDLKALMGDSSDNIPGVKGIGEKGALKLLQEYKTLDGIYENIDEIKGKTKEKLENDKSNAYFSYELATIYKEVPLEINLDDTYYNGPDVDKLNSIYSELEFYSLLKDNVKKEIEFNYQTVDNIPVLDKCSIYLESKDFNYFKTKPVGAGLYDGNNAYYISFENLIKNKEIFDKICITYDLKRLYVSLKREGIELENAPFDTMVASYLLEYNTKDDIAVLANNFGYNIPLIKEVYSKDGDISKAAALKAKFLYETKEKFLSELKNKELINLYENIELPLTKVLGRMEYNGIYVSRDVLENMGKEINDKMNLVSNNIYNLVGHEFNINSPKQLGEVLFDELGLSHVKKNQSGYSTANDVLTKLKGTHPVIDEIIEYRMLAKLYSTYIEGLINTISPDGKIHTIYSQVTARTGRLSSLEPNIQNIPVRYEYGKMIRKAFLPSDNAVILSSDYSQIELRILSSIAHIDSMIEAFKHGIDIHTKTAADIFKVNIDDVNKDMRRIAKAVNFGIIYGISGYGLAENVGISPKEAKEFIDNYLNTYPGIKEYMDNMKKEAYENGFVKTLFGRIRNVNELKNTNYMIRQQGERIALNTPIQGTSADIIKKAMIEIDRELINRNLKTKMIIQVHDELIFDVPNDEIEIVKKMVTELMENTCKLEVPLRVEIDYGDNWYNVK